MYILGLSCFYHDSAACLLKDGVPVAAASEQAFSRKKHDERFPVNAIRWALEEAQIEMSDVAMVSFYDKPLVKLSGPRVTCPLSEVIQAVRRACRVGFTKLRLDKLLKREFGYQGAIAYGHHHLSHAAAHSSPAAGTTPPC